MIQGMDKLNETEQALTLDYLQSLEVTVIDVTEPVSLMDNTCMFNPTVSNFNRLKKADVKVHVEDDHDTDWFDNHAYLFRSDLHDFRRYGYRLGGPYAWIIKGTDYLIDVVNYREILIKEGNSPDSVQETLINDFESLAGWVRDEWCYKYVGVHLNWAGMVFHDSVSGVHSKDVGATIKRLIDDIIRDAGKYQQDMELRRG